MAWIMLAIIGAPIIDLCMMLRIKDYALLVKAGRQEGSKLRSWQRVDSLLPSFVNLGNATA